MSYAIHITILYRITWNVYITYYMVHYEIENICYLYVITVLSLVLLKLLGKLAVYRNEANKFLRNCVEYSFFACPM